MVIQEIYKKFQVPDSGGVDDSLLSNPGISCLKDDFQLDKKWI